jgi:hypothetical protein
MTSLKVILLRLIRYHDEEFDNVRTSDAIDFLLLAPQNPPQVLISIPAGAGLSGTRSG